MGGQQVMSPMVTRCILAVKSLYKERQQPCSTLHHAGLPLEGHSTRLKTEVQHTSRGTVLVT
jgi:hypothetical protein